MDKEQKQKLFPYFAYLYSQEMNPEKYGDVTSIDEWMNLIQENEEDINAITEAADQLTDEDWEDLDAQYTEQISEKSAVMAKKGASLKRLRDVEKAKRGWLARRRMRRNPSPQMTTARPGAGPRIVVNAPSIQSPSGTIESSQNLDATRESNRLTNEINTGQFTGTFGDAFGRARAAGLTSFSWNGGKYTTELEQPAVQTQPATPSVQPAQPNRPFFEWQPTQPTQGLPSTPPWGSPTQPIINPPFAVGVKRPVSKYIIPRRG